MRCWLEVAKRARHGTLSHGTVHTAEQEITVAGEPLNYLERTGVAFEQGRQAHIDSWLGQDQPQNIWHRTSSVGPVKSRRLPPLDTPHRQGRSTPVLTQQERLALLDSCFRATTIALRNCVAAILLLLYAQPVSRMSRLRMDDIVGNGTTMTVAFGRHPAPVPDPIRRHHPRLRQPSLQHGHRGQPHIAVALPRLPTWTTTDPRLPDAATPRRRGLPLRSAKNGALRHLVLAMPPATAAQTLDYSTTAAEQHAKHSGAT